MTDYTADDVMAAYEEGRADERVQIAQAIEEYAKSYQRIATGYRHGAASVGGLLRLSQRRDHEEAAVIAESDERLMRRLAQRVREDTLNADRGLLP